VASGADVVDAAALRCALAPLLWLGKAVGKEACAGVCLDGGASTHDHVKHDVDEEEHEEQEEQEQEEEEEEGEEEQEEEEEEEEEEEVNEKAKLEAEEEAAGAGDDVHVEEDDNDAVTACDTASFSRSRLARAERCS
jgi:cobalamin biosynthesis protein CobT